ncbi:MAG TPA: family 16 glycoside hydrolase [Bacteroidales bacterium]|nr:family 16 glycoside hydrolase [Bacteroidales bacterium]
MKKILLFVFPVIGLFLVTSCGNRLKTGVEIPASGEKYWNYYGVQNTTDSVVLTGPGSFVVSKFSLKNFTLTADMVTEGEAEGLIDFHAQGDTGKTIKGYSVKINNSPYRSGSAQKTGGICHTRNNYVRMVPDGKQFRMVLEVAANRITVSVNDKIISEYIQPDSVNRTGDFAGMKLSQGFIRFRKTNIKGTITVSNIKIVKENDNLASVTDSLFINDSTGEMLTKLNEQDFPLIDFHGHLKGGLTVDEVCTHGREFGYNYGLAPNCGLNFPVTNDSTLRDYYNQMAAEPVFKAMQCEGREWITLFTPDVIALYDYIFTDAMTWTDNKGRRMRLWMPEETFVDNDQKFMDMLVSKIESELSKEPVDIYVNPTYLPEVIALRYNKLWTPERMDRVVKVLATNDIALEINSRFKIPSLEFVKRAKAAGVKFSFGTNNAGHDDLGRLDYSLYIIKEAGITADDVFIPRPEGQKKVLTKGLPKKITG